jgi:pyridoxamine 5'-phosphate oxidase
MADSPSIADIRTDYKLASLSEADTAAEPFAQFARWFDEALAAQVIEPTAMSLATVEPRTGQPSSRIVLLKGLDERGFTFYTNYTSRKANELAANPQVAALFFWAELERQVRIEGAVEKVSREDSEFYFHSRPRASQIAACTSRQSSVLSGRDELERLYAEKEAEFAGREVPLPDCWGGYRIIPRYLEFWQGRRSRLHDRIAYVREGNGWTRQRLAP